MENLSKQNNIEEIKNKIKNLTPEERAEKLKRARALQEQKQDRIFGGTKEEDAEAIVVECNITYAIDNKSNVDYESEIDYSGGVSWPIKGNYEFGDTFLLENGGEKYYNHITEVNGTVWFNDSEKFDFENLHTIVSDAMFKNSKVQALPSLETVWGNARFSDSEVKSLPKLTIVAGTLECIKGKAVELPKLKTVNGSFIASSSKLASLPCLKEVGVDADFSWCKNLKELPNLKKIGGNGKFAFSGVTSLPNLTSVGGHLNIEDCKIESLPNLQRVDGDICMTFGYGSVPLMPKLTKCKVIKVCYSEKTKIGVASWNRVSLTLEEFRRIENDLRKCKNLDNFNRIMGKIRKPEQDRVR